MYWVICVERLEKFSEIFYDHESVVISFDEPMELLSVVLVAVLESPLSSAPKILPAFTDIEVDGPELFVLLRAHEDEFVTVRSPGVFNVNSSAIMVGRSSHNPAEDLYISRHWVWPNSSLDTHWQTFRQYWWRCSTLDLWLL